MHKGIFVGILLSAIAIVALGSTFFYRRNVKEKNSDLTVVTSFYPMYIATENVTKGREGLRLESLSEPQTGCLHDYQLTPEDMKLLSEADVFVVNGGGIEEFLTDIVRQYPDLVIVDASEGVDLLGDDGGPGEDHAVGGERNLPGDDGKLEEDQRTDEEQALWSDADHADEPGDDHTGAQTNAHVWMSISLHRQQVKNIAEGLSAIDPSFRELYEQNTANYDRKLGDLMDKQNQIVAKLQGMPVILFHEAYAYVAKDYGLDVTFVLNLDEERQVSAGEVAQVMETITDQGISVVLAEEAYGKEMGDMVEAETSAYVFYLDTLVRGDYDSDSYLKRMEQNIATMKEALRYAKN